MPSCYSLYGLWVIFIVSAYFHIVAGELGGGGQFWVEGGGQFGVVADGFNWFRKVSDDVEWFAVFLFYLFNTFLKVYPGLQTNNYQLNPGELRNINNNIQYKCVHYKMMLRMSIVSLTSLKNKQTNKQTKQKQVNKNKS